MSRELTYPAQQWIIRFLQFDKRLSLVQSFPFIKALDKGTPYAFDKVEITQEHVVFNNLKFIISSKSDATTESKRPKLSTHVNVVGIPDDSGVEPKFSTPKEAIVTDLSRREFVEELIKFFVHRPGTVINSLEVDSAEFMNFLSHDGVTVNWTKCPTFLKLIMPGILNFASKKTVELVNKKRGEYNFDDFAPLKQLYHLLAVKKPIIGQTILLQWKPECGLLSGLQSFLAVNGAKLALYQRPWSATDSGSFSRMQCVLIQLRTADFVVTYESPEHFKDIKEWGLLVQVIKKGSCTLTQNEDWLSSFHQENGVIYLNQDRICDNGEDMANMCVKLPNVTKSILVPSSHIDQMDTLVSKIETYFTGRPNVTTSVDNKVNVNLNRFWTLKRTQPALVFSGNRNPVEDPNHNVVFIEGADREIEFHEIFYRILDSGTEQPEEFEGGLELKTKTDFIFVAEFDLDQLKQKTEDIRRMMKRRVCWTAARKEFFHINKFPDWEQFPAKSYMWRFPLQKFDVIVYSLQKNVISVDITKKRGGFPSF